MFQGLSERTRRAGVIEFRFRWLTREPLVLEYDAKEETLTFKHLLPQARRGSEIAGAAQALIEEQSRPGVAPHRRIDRRKAEAEGRVARGHWSLRLQVKGRQHEYAVRKGVNVVNELFTLLRASYPDYLGEVFGLSSE